MGSERPAVISGRGRGSQGCDGAAISSGRGAGVPIPKFARAWEWRSATFGSAAPAQIPLAGKPRQG